MVNSNDRIIVYATNGVTDTFALDFPLLKEADLQIWFLEDGEAEEVQVTSGFTLNVDLDEVTFTTAPADGQMAFVGVSEKTQEKTWEAGTPFNSESLENGLDRTTIGFQESSGLLAAALRLQYNDDLTTDVKLPLKADRANCLLGFDADGKPFATATYLSAALVSSFMETVLDDTSASAALTTLGFSSFVQTLLDDASAAAFLTTLGISSFIQTLLDDASASAARDTIGAAGVLPGEIKVYSSTSAPSGYLICNGETIGNVGSGADNESADYETLFDLLKASWGNAGTESFSGGDTVLLPDLIGASLAGAGTSSGYTEDETITFGTKHDDRLQNHTVHLWRDNSSAFVPFEVVATGAGSTTRLVMNQTSDPNKYPILADNGTDGTPRTGSTTRGKVVGVTYIIKY